MAWSNPTSVGIATRSTISPITVSASGVAGRTYVLCLSRSTATDPFTTVTDNAGNTWARADYAPKSGTAGRRIEYWTCVPTNVFSLVTIAFTGSGTAYATLLELANAGAQDAVLADFRASSTTPTAVTLTTTVADTMCIAICQANSNSVSQMTPSSGTALATDPQGPAIVYQNVASAGTVFGPSWTFAIAAGSGHAVIAFRPGTSTPPAGPTATYWNGTSEVSVTLEGYWNGTSVVPISGTVEIA